MNDNGRSGHKPQMDKTTLRQLLDAVPLPAALLTCEGRILYQSADFRDMFGYTPDDTPTEDDWWLLAFPDEHCREQARSAWREAIDRAVTEKGRPEPQQWALTVKDGSTKHMELCAAAIGDNCLLMLKDITEPQSLRVSEERLRYAMEAANDGLWDVNMRTSEVYLSPRGCEMLGYRPDQMHEVVAIWSDLVHPDDLPVTSERLCDYLEGRTPTFEVEQRLRTRSGDWKWVVARGKVVERDGENNPMRMVGTHTDITERKEAEDALRESERRYRSLIETMNEGFATADENYVFTYVNARFAEMLGREPDEMIGHRMADFLDEASRAALEEQSIRRRAGQRDHYETAWTALDGSRVHTIVSPVPILDNEGHFAGSFATLTDISQRKRAEEELALTNDELRAVNRVIAETAGAADPQTILELALDEAMGIVGLEGGTLCVIDKNDVFELAAHRATSPETLADIETGTIRVGECLCGMCAKTGIPLILPTKSEVDAYATREALRKEDIRFHAAFPLMVESRCLGVLCVFTRTDNKPTERSLKLLETITKQMATALERARLFEEVKRNAEELEHRIAERTKQLEEANKELEAFSYSVSHDLRAPLRAIDGFSLAVMEDYSAKLDDQGNEYLNRIRSASVRMGQLIDDILRLSRVTRAEMVRRKIDLSALVTSIASDLAESQPERRVEFIIEPELTVDADGSLMEIALENLVGNAWKFTGKSGNARIEFGAIREKRRKVFYIRDNGAGFNQAYADRLFAAFQRLHSGAEFPGTGVGLATVKRIIHKHGGEVWAVGEEDKGATFYFTLGSDG